MTRVVVIRPYAALPSEGGSNDRYVNLCKALLKHGAVPKLVCSDFIHNSKRHRTRVEKDMNVIDHPFLVQLRSLSYQYNFSLERIAHEIAFGFSALFYLMANPRPDVVVVGEPLFGVGWLMQLYGVVARVPVVADVIDLWPEADTTAQMGIFRRLVYGFLKLSRSIRLRSYRAVSFVSKSYAVRLGFKENTGIFYWGSELLPTKAHIYPDNRLQVIYAGSFGVGYDILTVLKAAEKLNGEMPGRFHFSVAGAGPQIADVKHAQAEGYIDYLGVLDRGSLIHQYEMSDVGLLPYKAGSMVAMPIKFFDYMNFGLYTITSLTLEAGQIVAERKIGAMYKAGDSDDLCNRLKAADANRQELGRVRDDIGSLAKEYSAEGQYDHFAQFVMKYSRGRN